MKSINNSIKAINRNFGGLNYKGSRVVFVNGKFDPAHAYSFYDQAPNPQTVLVNIDGATHCQDMMPSLSIDSSELIEARKKILTLIKSWLSE